jgi:LacI family transcriptional regulator
MVRLKDIAQAAGVSVMTVSKALRDKADLSPATKSRIRALAEHMGYVPDFSASGLRNRSQRLFGLVIAATTDPIYARVMLALEEAAHEMGYDLILAHTYGKTDREEAVIRRLIARRVDGLFVSPVYRMEAKAPIYEELRRCRIPTVLLGHAAPFCEDFPRVECDDKAASEAATRHLIELGHRRIAFLAGPSTAPWAKERLEGYRNALREADLPADSRLVFSAGSTISEGTAAALQYLQEQPGATAIQAVSDLVAIGAANALLNQGMRIPQELSVMGFGNILTSEYFRVPLSTVRQPKLRLGRLAMDCMTRMLRQETVASKRMPAELILRASTGRPPSGS